MNIRFHLTIISVLTFLLFVFIHTVQAQVNDSTRRRWNIDSVAIANGWDTSSQRVVTDEEVSRLLSMLNNNYLLINRVNAATALKFKIDEIQYNNLQVSANLEGLRQNLNDTVRVLTVRTLQMYHTLIEEMIGELDHWQSTLQTQEDHLEKLSGEMQRVRRDTNFMFLLSNKNLRSKYRNRLQEIRIKWRSADSTTTAHLNRIRWIKNKVSENYIISAEANYTIQQQLRLVTSRLFDKQTNFLWERDIKEYSASSSRRTFKAEKNAMEYYFSRQSSGRIAIICFGVFFFGWIFYNYRFLKRRGSQKILSELKFITSFPITATLIVVFALYPFTDLHSPAVFVEGIQFLQLLVLSGIFFKRWPRHMFYSWLGIMLLYLLFSFSRGIVHPSRIERIFLIGLNSGAILFISFFLRSMKRRVMLLPFINPILTFSIGLNVLAVLCNVLGRITLAKTLGAAGVFGMTYIVGLSIFMRIITEAMYLQIQKSRRMNNFKTVLSFEQVSPLFKSFLTLLIIYLWLIFFSVNLNIYDPIFSWLEQFFNKPRILGSVTFTYGNLAIFILVIYGAFVLQKLTTYCMGIIDKDTIIYENMGRKGNVLLFLRLIIILGGFLFAITASSLPVDRITIVFSALGVGIGLGLQGIVSNFVSGIILIFERPFHIGDTIEIGSKIGKVKNISIRSSVLQTDYGSEIIIPNGDLLSQQVTNWTLSNRYVVRELKFFLEGNEDFRKAKSIIVELLKEQPLILQSRSVQVLVEEINIQYIKILVQVWIKDINDTEEVKSELKATIFERLKKEGVLLRSPL